MAHPPQDPAAPRPTFDAFFGADNVRLLVRRTYEAARSETERRLFASILRRAREDAYELEVLYNELPGVLADDHIATENFRNVLDLSFGQGIGLEPFPSPPLDGFGGFGDFGGLIPDPNAFPCDPAIFIDRFKISYIAFGISRIARDNGKLRDAYINTLRGLWAKTLILQRLYHHAYHRGDEGRDRLAEDLRMIARDLESYGQFGHGEWMGRPEGFPGEMPPNESFPGAPPFGEPPFGEPPFPPGHPPEGGVHYPPPDDPFPWPGPDDGPGLPWPPKGGPGLPPGGFPDGFPGGRPGGRPPGSKFDPCNFFDDPCTHISLDPLVLPESAWAHNIASVNPPTACPGETVTITGSGFGASKPADVTLLVGSQEIPLGDIVSWSNTQIVFKVPAAGLKSGCVGFRSAAIEKDRAAALAKWNGKRGAFAACFGMSEESVTLPYIADKPPCTAFNYFAGTLPEILMFEVNGGMEITVDINTPLTLAWTTLNATRTRIGGSPNAPVVDNTIDRPVNGTLTIGPVTGSQPLDMVYQLTAHNRCGEVQAHVVVHMRKKPALSIRGVEVIQVIQSFNLATPATNNSVPFVARKRTVARVYVDSGITDGFNYGAGANMLPGIKGTLTLSGLISPVTATPLSPTTIAAGSGATGDRNNLANTLNFELPWPVLTGKLTLSVNVWAQNPALPGPGWSDVNASTQIDFQSRPKRDIVRILVAEMGGTIFAPTIAQPAPTAADFENSLQGARSRYPIAEDGFVIRLAPGYENIGTFANLRTRDGWEDLLEEIDDIADDFEDHLEFVWAALTPNVAGYTLNGIANDISERIWPLEDDDRRMAVRMGLQGTFAHEMGHAFGLGHSNCCLPAGEAPDSRLPANGAIEDVGLDIPNMTLIPAGRGDIMSYCGDTASCGGATRWSSIAFWNVMFNIPG